MSFNLAWVFAIAFSYMAAEASGQLSIDPLSDSSSSNSDSFAIFDDFELSDKPFVEVRNMIVESRSIVMNILRGKEPEAIRNQIRRRYPKLTRFFRGVSQSVSLCLKKYGSPSERIRNAAVCFTEAVKNRQNGDKVEEEEEEEEEEKEVTPAQDCLEEAMIDAATEAAPLIVDAQEAYQRFRHLMTDTGRKMMLCRQDIRPFECVRTVWADAMIEMAELRNDAVEMFYRAQALFTKYTDSMRYCLTPVEEPEEEVEEEVEYDEEKKGQEETTEGSKCLVQNEYDSVDPDPETRVNNCDDAPQSQNTNRLS